MHNHKCLSNVSVERTHEDDEKTGYLAIPIPRDMAERLDIINSRVLLHVMELNEKNCLMISKYTEEIVIE